MNQPNIQVEVRDHSDVAVIHIAGEVTGFAEETLMKAYSQVDNDPIRTVLLDFTRLEYMNSTGIGLLVTLLIRSQRQAQRLLACGLSEHYKQIFDLTRLNEAIALYDTEEEALAAVGN